MQKEELRRIGGENMARGPSNPLANLGLFTLFSREHEHGRRPAQDRNACKRFSKCSSVSILLLSSRVFLRNVIWEIKMTIGSEMK